MISRLPMAGIRDSPHKPECRGYSNTTIHIPFSLFLHPLTALLRSSSSSHTYKAFPQVLLNIHNGRSKTQLHRFATHPRQHRHLRPVRTILPFLNNKSLTSSQHFTESRRCGHNPCHPDTTRQSRKRWIERYSPRWPALQNPSGSGQALEARPASCRGHLRWKR